MANDTVPVEKKCNTCSQLKLSAEFQRRSASADGLQPRCKTCAAEYKREHYAKNRDRILEKSRKDGRLYRELNREKDRARHKRYREENRDANRERQRQYRQNNREAIAKREQRYVKDHPDVRRAKDSRYRQRNQELIAEQKRAYNRANTEQTAKAWKRWAEANPDRAAATSRRWRARKLAAYSEAYTRSEVWSKSRGICGICDASIEVSDGVWHIDHIVPLSRGGSDTLANTQAAHAYCNLSKGNRVRPKS